MIYGTTIFYGDGNAYYTPEFSRGGLSANLAIEVLNLALTGATQMEFQLESRNSEDTSWTPIGSTTNAPSVANYDWSVSGGILEICRIRVGFGGGSPVASDMGHIFIQAPSWRPY